MKKYMILIVDSVLITLIAVALVFVFIRIANHQSSSGSEEPTEAATADEPTWAPSPSQASDDEPTERFRVGVVRHGLDKDSDNCYEGFIAQMDKRKLLDSVEIEYVIENDDEKCIEEIWRLIDEEYDLIYTIGPFASKYASTATLDIPIVFAAVSDPEEMDLVVSNEAPGGNVTGVSSYTPCFEQIDLIPVLLPKTDRVAVIYNSTDVDAVRQAIIACREAEDFEYTADKYKVYNEEGLNKALADIKSNGTDVIYLPVDQFVGKNLDTIVAFSEENGIPIICGNRGMMSRGCLATCEINYTSVGRKAADLCCDILFAEKEPATLPVIYKYDCYNFVNRQAMERLGIELSDVAKANVEIVDYEDHR